jgi:hypothetical protein
MSTIARGPFGFPEQMQTDEIDLIEGDQEEFERDREEFDEQFIRDGFEDEETAVNTVESLFRTSRDRMYSHLRQWCANILMYRGMHYVVWDRNNPYLFENGQIEYPWDTHPDDEYSSKARYAANFLQGHMDAWIAKMVAHDPRIVTFPVNDDEQGRELADMGRMILAWKDEQQNFSDKYLHAITLLAMMGNVFIKACHNPMGGMMFNPFKGMKPGDIQLAQQDPRFAELKGISPDLAAQGMAGWDQMDFEGDVESIIVPAYEISYPEEYIRGLDDANCMIHSYITTMQALKEQHGDHPKIDEVTPGLDEQGYQIWFMEKVSNLAQGNEWGTGGEADSEDATGQVLDNFTYVMVHEFWGKMSRHRPKGLFAKVAGGVLLDPVNIEEIANPYMHGQLPFAHLKQCDDRTVLWSTSKIEQGSACQHEYNSGASQIIESRNLTANPITLEEKGTLLQKDDILNVPGEVWQVRPGRLNGIKRLETQNLPAYVHQFLFECRGAMEQIFADYSPQQGESVPGDSGKKVRALQMANEERHIPYARGIAAGLKRHKIQILQLLAQYTEQERIGYVTGSEHERSFFRWSRHTLAPLDANTVGQFTSPDEQARMMIYSLHHRLDLRVEVMPGKSHATAQEDVQLLLQAGMVNPQNPRHFKMVMDMLDYHYETPELLNEKREQSSQAQKENDEFLDTGQPPLPPGQYEDHEEHLRKHRKLTTMERFRSMPPPVQAQFLLHCQLHEEAIIAEPMRMAYIQQKVALQLQQQLGPLLMGGPEAEQGDSNGKPAQRRQAGESAGR